MVKFNAISDIHVDFYTDQVNRILELYTREVSIIGNLEELSDIDKQKVQDSIIDFVYKMLENTKEITESLFILGDISNYNIHSIFLLEELSKYWSNIYWTDGNHDYYMQNKNQNRVELLIESTKHLCNVHYVNNEIITLEGKLNIGMSGLMYNLNDNFVTFHFCNKMNDSRFINKDFLRKKYEESVNFYNISKENKNIDIFMTHCPIVPLYPNEKETTYYTEIDLDPDIYYVFGHTHDVDEREHKGSVGFNIGIGYPLEYDRGRGYPHTETFEYNIKNRILNKI